MLSADGLYGLFDTHAHLNDPQFDSDRETILSKMAELGMLNICVGTDMQTSRSCIQLARQFPFLYASVGIHPEEVASFHPDTDLPQLRTWLTGESRVVALGEIGLDYHVDFPSREDQKAAFTAQLSLAYELSVPVILHIRNAHGDVMDIMRAMAGRLPRCLIHCSSARWETTRFYLNHDCMISFAGPVTFRNASHLQEAAAKVPLDHLLIETDSPYLSPEPFRGRRNNPTFVSHICAFLAELRKMDPQELANITRDNGKKFFGITE